ncbi:glycosyltransferase family 4 protein [Aeromonas diversa]|uniref:glycosyltransferase family 4 protein n=1 Tax=Aeromonas diversa TaxID=502790 RepID=UPI0034629BDB
MKVLLIHQNFPGQLRHIAEHLRTRDDVELLAVGRDTAPGLEGVALLRYRPSRQAGAQTHPYLLGFEEGVLHGQAVVRRLQPLAERGYRPDVILAHPGWGETLFVRELFPTARLVHYCEFYYHSQGADADFDPEFPLSLDGPARIRARNALHLLNLEQCDAGVCPTHWQQSLHPAAYHGKLRVVHEGIRTERLRPDPEATLALPNGRVLRAGQKIITYVARNLEPYRGFHRLMRNLPALLAADPECQVVIVGGDGVSYGSPPRGAGSWRETLLAEHPVDPDRVHFLGKVPYDVYVRVLQVSAVHLYLTYPFVLSWSLLEAMSCGCRVVASDTAPLHEVIRDGENGRLVGFFDDAALVQQTMALLGDRHEAMGQAARATALSYDIQPGVAAYLDLLGLGQ